MLKKSEFIKAYAEARGGIPKTRATEEVNCFLSVLSDAIKNEGVVLFTGLLSIRKVLRKSRTCKNPTTGKTITTSDHNAISVKLGDKLKEYINE